MELNLKRPLIIFDLESTGLNIIHDRIVEISYLKIFPDGREEAVTMRINPEMPIPKESTAIHHITDGDVADSPTFKDVAEQLAATFADCDVAGYNSNNFDIPLLDEEWRRAGVDFDWSARRFIDVQTIFHKMEKRDLAAASRFYCGREMENHHSAEADTRTTYDVLRAQLDRYPSLVNDVDALSKFSTFARLADLVGRVIYNSKGQEVVNFGKYKGKLLEDVLQTDTHYYGWVLNGDFPNSTKRVFERVFNRIQQARDQEKLQQLQEKFSGKLT